MISTIDSPDSEEFETVERDPKEVQVKEAFEEFWSDPCWTGPASEISKGGSTNADWLRMEMAAHMSKL